MSSIFQQILFEVSTLILVGTIIIHAAFRVVRRPTAGLQGSAGNKAHIFCLLFDIGWFVVAASLLILWPESLDTQLYPRRSFLFFGTIAVFLASNALNVSPEKPWAKFSHVVSRAFLGIGVVVCIYLAFQYLVFVRPRMEGRDFYFYVCTARHMASGLGDLSLVRYFYFPGVYTFWRMALNLGDGNLSSLQWWYLILIAANAVVVGGVIYRVIRNAYASIVAFLWYIAFCSRFEGFVGASEPIAALPMLLGLFLWGGRPLTGKGGVWRIFALGTGLGLGVYTRQQAGLVSLGAISLLLTYFPYGRHNPVVSLKGLILLASVSTAVLLSGIAMEGFGLQPLFIGLTQIPEYGSSVNIWDVVWNSARKVPLLSVVSLIALISWISGLLLQRFRSFIVEPWFQMLGFTCVGGFLSLIPFFSRAHAHYALFTGPLLIIAATIAAFVLGRGILKDYARKPVIRLAILILLLAPFIRSNFSSGSFYVWPLTKPVNSPQPRPWRLTPGLSSDLEMMKKYIQADDKIYVLPPRHNEIHFFLGTHHANYGWGNPISLSEQIQQQKVNGVIVIDAGVLPKNIPYSAFQYDQAPEILEKNGFKTVIQLSTMTLWRPVRLNEDQ